MASHVQNLCKQNLLKPPKWLADNIQYEAVTGSTAYGVAANDADYDVIGFVIPPKELVFPHLAGEILGFGKQKKRFDQFQQHHIITDTRQYDVTVYSIVKFFQLCMENNPNMVDTLFVPNRCVLHSTRIAQIVRDKRRLFLHKGSYHKFRGYAYAQLSKIRTKSNSTNPKRMASIEKYGYDVKFAYHVVRLALEAEQILTEGNLELDRDRAILKSIRQGEWSKERIFDWFTNKESHLEHLYKTSVLRNEPDEEAIKNLLLQCLEEHYGSLSNAVTKQDTSSYILSDLQQLLDKYL